jgi:hypothetical protein
VRGLTVGADLALGAVLSCAIKHSLGLLHQRYVPLVQVALQWEA